MRVARWLAALLIISCGESDTADVEGQWVASLVHFSDAGFLCSFPEVAVTIRQRGEVISGEYETAPGTCKSANVTFGDTLYTGVLLDGEVNGSQVRFNVDDWGNKFTGTVMPGELQMFGSGKIRMHLKEAGDVMLTGSFSAAREQP